MARAIASSTRLNTNSPTSRMLTVVSLAPPSGLRRSPSTTSGGSSANTLKKLNGAALMGPLALCEVTSAIGRGTIRPPSSL
jgi:hypothetical protein